MSPLVPALVTVALASTWLAGAMPLAAQSPAARPVPADSAAPADERWQITLDQDRYVWDVRLVRLDGDTLVVRQSDSLVRVPVAKMSEIRLIQKSEMQVGAPAGGAMGALMGTDDEVYDLTPLDFADKLKAVRKIFVYHPVGGR